MWALLGDVIVTRAHALPSCLPEVVEGLPQALPPGEPLRGNRVWMVPTNPPGQHGLESKHRVSQFICIFYYTK